MQKKIAFLSLAALMAAAAVAYRGRLSRPGGPMPPYVLDAGSPAPVVRARWAVEDGMARLSDWRDAGLREDGVLAGRWPGSAMAAADFPWRGHAPDWVEADIFWPKDTPPGSGLVFFAQDKDGLWFQAEPEKRPERGQWNTLLFRVSPRDGRMEPVGHSAVWNRYYQTRMARAGFLFHCPAPWSGGPRLKPSFRMARSEEAASARILRLDAAPRAIDAFAPAQFAFTLEADPDNPFDPDELAIDFVALAPSGRALRIPAFYDQPHRRWLDSAETEQTAPAGRARWLARYAPLEPGVHRWRLEAAGRLSGSPDGGQPAPLTAWRELEARPAKPRGFVRVSPLDPKHLETIGGEPFYPVGLNLHSPFCITAARMLQTPAPPDRGTFMYDGYFPEMREAGMNTAVIWMSNWWVSLEWNADWKGHRGLGDYNLSNAWRLDRVFEAALEHGIHIFLSLDNHGKYQGAGGKDGEWGSSPFAAANGGPCTEPEDFFASDEAFGVYRKRLRYIAGRWGSYPNLLAFSLVSEIDLTGGGQTPFRWHPAKTDWAVRAADELARLCPYAPMTGMQYAGNWPGVNPAMAERPEIAFTSGSAYDDHGRNVALYLETAERMAVYGKPFLVVEYGRHLRGGQGAGMLRADLHAGLWASAMTASAALPLPWWHDFVHRNRLWGDWRGLSRFMEGEDRRGLFLRTFAPPVTNGGDIRERPEKPPVSAVSMTDGVRGWFWMYDETSVLEWPMEADAPVARSTVSGRLGRDGSDSAPWRVHRDLRCLLPGFLAGTYRVDYWDTLSGEIVHTETVTGGAEGVMASPPPFWLDVAGKVTPMRATPAERDAGNGTEWWLRAAAGGVLSPDMDGMP